MKNIVDVEAECKKAYRRIFDSELAKLPPHLLTTRERVEQLFDAATSTADLDNLLAEVRSLSRTPEVPSKRGDADNL